MKFSYGKTFRIILSVLCVLLLLVGCQKKGKKGKGRKQAVAAISDWPPQLLMPYPDKEYVDQDGNERRLSEFQGQVILVEMVGMNCPACQAFSGALHKGSFEGIIPQQNLASVDRIFERYSGSANFEDVIFVQLLLYDMRMNAPDANDARRWAKHFGFKTENNHFVLVPKESLIGPASYNLIPGFQLVDRNFVLRLDSTGHKPKHSLYKQLFPRVPTLLAEPDKLSPVKKAYEAIPHRRTMYDYYSSTLPADTAKTLFQFFRLTDQAVAARVNALQGLLSDGKEGISLARYSLLIEQIREQLARMKMEGPLERPKSKVMLALIDHERFFKKWAQKREEGEKFTKLDPADASIRASHRGLVSAYEALKEAFPQETEHNQQAFFDHLCALDFV